MDTFRVGEARSQFIQIESSRNGGRLFCRYILQQNPVLYINIATSLCALQLWLRSLAPHFRKSEKLTPAYAEYFKSNWQSKTITNKPSSKTIKIRQRTPITVVILRRWRRSIVRTQGLSERNYWQTHEGNTQTNSQQAMRTPKLQGLETVFFSSDSLPFSPAL